MLEYALGDEGAEFLVVGIGEFVVNDFGENTVFVGESDKFIEFGEAEYGRFLDEDVFAGDEGRTSCLEVPVVRSGDANRINTASNKAVDDIWPGEVLKWRDN